MCSHYIFMHVLNVRARHYYGEDRPRMTLALSATIPSHSYIIVGELRDYMIRAGKYVYMEDLRMLSSCIAPTPAPAALKGINTPLKREAWQVHLSQHPDKEFAGYLLQGIEHGFQDWL